MTISVRRLASASLVDPVNDPSDRNQMPMSTLLATEEWLLEAAWDGMSIGDVHIFRNTAYRVQGAQPRWAWWMGVPHAKIKAYRFAVEEAKFLQPATLELPFGAEREAKSGSTGKQAAKS